MNTQTNGCDHQRIDDFLNSDHVALDDAQLVDHLDLCADCREYMETRAAEPESWTKATEWLKSTEFDHAGSAEFSAATIGHQRIAQPVVMQNVLDSLTPSDDPNRLGRLGGYEVSGVVGAGGMGVVLKAVDPSLDRVVAIKVMAPHLANNATARKRFSREAKAAAAVLHPNVIPIHSVSSDEAIPYLVMAYIRGGSLQKRLGREGSLSTVEILRIGSQIAAGLAAAHEQGLVHRDIKPENILLEEGVERVTLTDFGLARAVDDASLTREGTIAGTPQYMSPEQARGESVDQKSDLFSLGSVLYALCTGRPPFRADTSYGVMRRISDESPTPIRELNPDIPEWLSDIIEKLMSKDKKNRFESAGEVHELLDACLSHVQQPTVVPLPHQRLPQFGKQRAKRSPTPQAFKRFVMLTAIIVFGASGLGLLGIRGCDKHSTSEVNAAHEEVRSYYDGSKNVFPGNPINLLLVSNTGPEYLKKLSQDFERIAYVEGDFSYGFTQIVVYMCDNRQSPRQPEIILTARREGYQQGGGVGFPDQIKPTSIRILRRDSADGQLVIEFTTSDEAKHRDSINKHFGLIPGETYTVEIDIIDIIEDRVDGIEVWKQGKPQTVAAATPNRPADANGAPQVEDDAAHDSDERKARDPEAIRQIGELLDAWKRLAEQSEESEVFAKKISTIRDELYKHQVPNTEKSRQTLARLALLSWPHLSDAIPKSMAQTLTDLTKPDAAIRVSDRLAEAGRPTEPVGWDVQATHALALARAGKTEEALKENQALMKKIDFNMRKGRLPNLQLEFLGRTRSQKSLLKQTLLQKSLILAIAGRTVESVDASTAAGHVEVNAPTQNDQSAIQAMIRMLAKVVDPADSTFK